MAKYVYKNLLDRQIRVTKIAGYLIAAFFGVVYLVARYGFNVSSPLLTITGLFVLSCLVSLLAYEWHKKVYITYQLLIFMSYLVVIALAYFTGGVSSPSIFILTLCPIAAFSTSKKQGFLWSVIAFVTVFILMLIRNYLPDPINILNSQEARQMFSFVAVVFVLTLGILIAFLVNRSTFEVHRAYDRDSKELQSKSIRLENLVTLLNYSDDLMCIVDQNSFTIDDLNPVFKTLLGFELSEIRGKNLMNFIKQDESSSNLEKDIKSMKDDEVLEFNCKVVCKDGSEKDFKWTGITKNGKMHASARLLA